ncbi:pyridoxamine 5'-phosphate oxidase family protein [Luedemannella flava]|uniref:pyridoxamine 5'-phosphate oxidase family protein n=1 Tax=Luedemannella flava TaxID=349316 RepID=UPI0031CE95D8
MTLTTDQVWSALGRASFAVLSHVTPAGAPRSTGVLYAAHDRRLFVVVASDGWKARHIAADGRVSVTVPVRRGGPLSLLFPIPPATVSFPATAVVHEAGSREGARILSAMMHRLPRERLSQSRIIEIRPEGHFVTYGLGVSLTRMRHPGLARARVPVSG